MQVLSAPPGPDYVDVGELSFDAYLIGGRQQHTYKSPNQLAADLHDDICAVGGDTLVTERNAAGEITRGTVYRRSTLPQLPDRPVQPPHTEACEPSCATGYSCEGGACVSMCNPACADGQTCGNDALCHPVE